jgi:hypothetical protein
MKRKYLAFDIETAKVLPRDVAGGDILAHRPLGITCAAALATDQKDPQLFYSRDAGGIHSAQMRKDDLSCLVDFLVDQVKNGYTMLTLNGLGFDFDVLAEESGRLNDCRKLAVGHVDMMFHVVCCKGFGVGLDAAGEAIGIRKLEGVESQDCRIALGVAETSEQRRSFSWIARSGKASDLALPKGWLTAQDAMKQPPPDTSGMKFAPWPRSKFTQWLG